jgi:putative hydrolase of the HAD superfamily
MDEKRYWVFDLDDTLYPEKDYVRSALMYLGAEVERVFGEVHFTDLLLDLWLQGVEDPIAQGWLQRAVPDTARTPIIDAMRAHVPSIALSVGASALIGHLRRLNQAYAIVTDGRSITQRAKIAALGCNDAKFISISEEAGLSKLDPKRFMAVATIFPPGKINYVGDNPAKDFFAPKQLGWATIMLDHKGQGVHSQCLPNDPAYHPDQVVADLIELLPL